MSKPKAFENKKGITVAELKMVIAHWPSTDFEGEPTEVWIDNGDDTSRPCFRIMPLNLRGYEDAATADVILE